MNRSGPFRPATWWPALALLIGATLVGLIVAQVLLAPTGAELADLGAYFLLVSAEGQSFRVDNRGTYTAVACSPYEEPFREGYRFADGERYVMFLEDEVDGLWQVGYLGLAAFPAPANENEKLRTDWYASPGAVFDLTLGDIRALVVQREAPPLRPAATTSAASSGEQPGPDGKVQGRSSTAPEPGGDGRTVMWALAIAGVLAAGAAAFWSAGRFRRGR